MLQGSYIDIHSHILPGVDDGPESIEQTIRMLHMAISEGINTIIATPHYEPGGDNPSVDELERIRKQVEEEAFNISRKIKLYLGNEVYYGESAVSLLKAGEALTLAGSRYVLVEFPYGIDIKSMYQGMYNFLSHGYLPILAHVERYHHIHRRPDVIEELVDMGCYIQMNCDSIVGSLLNTEVSFNRRLIKNGLVHFIASDSHSDKMRVPMMQTAVNYMLKKFSEEAVNELISENPMKVLENKYI